MKYRHRSVAVFCGSKAGENELFSIHARQLGSLLAREGHTMVYGGGGKGLMGDVANAMLEHDGKIIGIIPEHLRGWEAHHTGLEDLRIVSDMHVRKRMMYELSEIAVIMPGGYGTMDELFELLTWNQLALHSIPVLVLNTAGYYNDLFQALQVMYRNGFLYEKPEQRIKLFEVPELLVQAIQEAD